MMHACYRIPVRFLYDSYMMMMTMMIMMIMMTMVMMMMMLMLGHLLHGPDRPGGRRPSVGGVLNKFMLCFNGNLMFYLLPAETELCGRSMSPLLKLAPLGLHCGGRKRLYFGIGAAWTDRTLSATRTCSFSGVVISGRTSRAPQDVSRKLSHQQEV